MDEYSALLIQQGSCTYELTEIVTVCTSPMKPQLKPNPKMRGGRPEALPVAEELLAVDSCGEREIHFR